MSLHPHHLAAAVGACVASSLLLGAAPSMAQAGQPDCAAFASPTRLEQRLLDKAEQGVDSLRQYIFISRGVRQLDMMEVVAWLDARRASAATCTARADRAGASLGAVSVRSQ
jgi:hypothetical protein